MKKALNIFFVSLGVIFFILIMISLYLYLTDPWGLKPLLFGSATGESGESSTVGTGEADKHPALSTEQEKALETVGIDPASLPSQITPAQMSCFEAILGAARVEEIKAGATPTMSEFFQARGCL